ncbi:MAG: uracil-DNA glycosylase [Candidatus Kaiserbacteria bacterium]|nr:uracil-DNA glycosylase [Candidatus Kaiserbacteria bacterium]
MTEKSNIHIESSWKEHLTPILEKPDMVTLRQTIRTYYQDPSKRICPQPQDVFHAFNRCPFSDVAVVILGQDPYHGSGQAHGLSFSVPEGITAPPSLKNIFKEIQSDVGTDQPSHGDLSRWADQGVFLLNAILTVEAGKPASHRGIGWEQFTDTVITLLSKKRDRLVFMLWGAYAKQKQELIDTEKHLVLSAAHPSPYSAANGFFGCKHFSQANTYLTEHGKPTVTW